MNQQQAQSIKNKSQMNQHQLTIDQKWINIKQRQPTSINNKYKMNKHQATSTNIN